MDGVGGGHSQGAERGIIIMRSMFTHLENDLCRTIFVYIYLIYVEMLHNFRARLSALSIRWRGKDSIHLNAFSLFLIYRIHFPLLLHELNAICIHFPWSADEAEQFSPSFDVDSCGKSF